MRRRGCGSYPSAHDDVIVILDGATPARALADRLDPLILEKPPELATMDYLKFGDWYARVLALLGREEGYKRYGARTVFELRMTPEETAREIDWEAFWG